MSRWFGRAVHFTFERVLPPVLLLVTVIAAWQFAVWVFELKPYLLPGPDRVARAIVKNWSRLADAFAITSLAAIAGFLTSLIVGTLVGFVFSQSRIIRSSGYPYAIFLQTVPIVAIAPLIIFWCGRGLGGVIVVAFILSVFPIIANATAGLTQLDPDLLDLFRLNNASRWQTLWKLRFPSAIPAILTGAKTSGGLAVVGAIVGEFYAGYGRGRTGLGFLIRSTTDESRIDELFAAIAASTLLGVLIFATMNLLSSWILRRWYDLAAETRND